MHLIDLDVAVFEMFDLPPMNEYELYIKNFGRSDTKQVNMNHFQYNKMQNSTVGKVHLVVEPTVL